MSLAPQPVTAFDASACCARARRRQGSPLALRPRLGGAGGLDTGCARAFLAIASNVVEYVRWFPGDRAGARDMNRR
jgi:hypothetical protein